MIFVTLGSQKFQFDRLLRAIDELKTEEKIFAQTGFSDYIPENYEYKPFIDQAEYDRIMEEADIVITHGGTGAIIGAVKKGKKVIAVPRLKKFGEHVDDHQLQLVHEFAKMDLIYACDDMDLEKALNVVRDKKYKGYQSNTKVIIESIEEFINTI